MKKIQLRFIPIFCLLASACSTTTHLISEENLEQSKIEITYALGHDQYKYLARGGSDKAEISSYHDDQILEKRTIPLERYQIFVSKLEDALPSDSADDLDANCRTPYKIQVTTKDQQRTVSGCRSADTKGQIGQLLNEGEFLFYSGKSEK